ncbi:MAG TPA: PepSY-associated TM helix domain-containing protein [Gemmatimonadaceae bacterium]|nr:PepSY-associated TM helix domain-containing protein [Gemmatimonadaceae bacterium]
MKAFRTLVFWLHLLTGITVGIVVLIMSVTGVLLTYEKQMLRWADARALERRAPSPSAPRLDVATLVDRARVASPGTPTAVTWRAGDGAPVEVAFGRERTLFLDPSTGAVLGQGSAGARRFFRVVTDWHRWLGREGPRRALGKSITGLANLGFLFIIVSGIYLWWPRHWTRRTLRSVTLFRRGLRSKARDFNWHNVIGLWSWAPLVVVVASGVVISYPWATSLVYRTVGETPPAPRPPAAPAAMSPRAPGAGHTDAGPLLLAGLDPLVARAAARVAGWRSVTLTLPTRSDAPVTFAIDAGTGGQPQKRAELQLDRATGAEVKWTPFSAGTPGRRLRSILRFAHTGEVLGLVGQTIAGIVSLGAVFLVYTGLALSLRRLLKWTRRRRRFGVDGAARGVRARA